MKNKIYLISILFLAFFHFQIAVSAVKVACVGNSITAGYLLASSQSYPSVLQTLMGLDYEVQNFGVSGTTYLVTTGDSWSYWGVNGKINQVVSYLPNKIIIELGTNDSKSSYTTYRNVLETDIEKMILKFKALASNPEIFLCVPIPAINSNFDIQSSVIENEIIPKIRQAALNQNVKLIDLHTTFSNHHELYADGIHPNADGARIIAGIVNMNIAPIVKVTGVSLNLSDLSIVEGQVKSLTPTVQPSTASVKEVFWSSNHPEIATVSASGKVSGVAVGSCTITAQTLDGDFIAACSVTVAKNNLAPWIIVDDTDAGWIWSGYANDPCNTCFQGSAHSSNVVGASAQFTFTGTNVEAYCETWDGGGLVDIYIDEVLRGSYSQAVTPYGGGNIFASIDGLSNSVHTIRFVSTSINWTGIDYIRYTAENTSSLSNENSLKQDIDFYPNPASNFLCVQTELQGFEHANISIYNSMLQLVLSANGADKAINISKLSSGIYFVKVGLNNQELTKKIIVNQKKE